MERFCPSNLAAVIDQKLPFLIALLGKKVISLLHIIRIKTNKKITTYVLSK